MAEKIFANDGLVARDEECDIGDVEGGEGSLDLLPDSVTLPFPHELHPALTQEWLRTFRSEVLVDATPGSGFRLRAALQSNVRAIALARNAAHKAFLQVRSPRFDLSHVRVFEELVF